MKRLMVILSALIIGLIAIAPIAAYASASQTNDPVNHSVYQVGANVSISGSTINGDIFCAGQTVNISSVVNGDIICAGQTINIDGRVNGNIRLIGQNVNLNSTVTRSVSIAGQDISINKNAKVGLDLSLAGETANIDGTVSRDANVAINNLTINGIIGRNATVYTNDLSLGKNSLIQGSITYTSPNKIPKTDYSRVKGTITYHKGKVSNTNTIGNFIFFRIYWLVALVVMTVVLVALFPGLFKRWNAKKVRDFWWKMLAGFIGMFAIPISILVLMATVIGVPLGFLLLFIWMALALLSMPFAAFFIGSLVAKNLHPVLIGLIGALILGIIELIPFVGWIFVLISYWLGSGSLILGLKGSYTRNGD